MAAPISVSPAVSLAQYGPSRKLNIGPSQYLLYISGTTARQQDGRIPPFANDADATKPPDRSLEDTEIVSAVAVQTELIFKRMAQIINEESNGTAGLESLVELTIFLADLKSDYASMNKVYNQSLVQNAVNPLRSSSEINAAVRRTTDTFFINTFSRHIYLYLQNRDRRPKKGGSSFNFDLAADGTKLCLDHVDEDLISPCTAPSPGGEDQVLTRLFQRCNSPSPQVGNYFGFVSEIDSLDCHILQYYDHIICSNTSLLDDEAHNPFRYVMLPIASSSTMVFKAILAIGAGKLAFQEPRYRHRAVLHRHRLLKHLRQSIPDVENDLSKCLDATASALILCWYDISDFCRPSWTDHLRGLAHLLKIYERRKHWFSQAEKLYKCCQQYLISHLVLAKATFNTDGVLPDVKHLLSGYGSVSAEPNFDYELCSLPSLSNRILGESHVPKSPSGLINMNEDIEHIEAQQGFSNELLFLIYDVCKLSEGTPCTSQDRRRLAEEIHRIEKRLLHLRQLSPPSLESRVGQSLHFVETGKEAEASLEQKLLSMTAHAEATRSAALLLLQLVCESYHPNLVPKFQSSRQDLVEDVFSQAEIICEIGIITAALPTWAVFVAGCLVSEDEQRQRVMRIMSGFQLPRRYGQAQSSRWCGVNTTSGQTRTPENLDNQPGFWIYRHYTGT
ncbi:hypothetical protein ABEF95_015275 [Exophiala dermatitidis]